MSPPDRAIAPSPKTEAAMLRMRRAVYALMAVLVVGAIISGAAGILLLQRIEEQAAHIEQIAGDNAEVLRLDRDDTKESEERLGRALDEIRRQFEANDEASAQRDEAILHELGHVRQERNDDGSEAPVPQRDLPRRDVPDRPATKNDPPPPAPPPPPPPSSPPPSSERPDPPPARCSVRVLGACLAR